jgi:hypothetical protein
MAPAVLGAAAQIPELKGYSTASNLVTVTGLPSGLPFNPRMRGVSTSEYDQLLPETAETVGVLRSPVSPAGHRCQRRTACDNTHKVTPYNLAD